MNVRYIVQQGAAKGLVIQMRCGVHRAPEGKRGRPPFAVEAMLRIHFMQWRTFTCPNWRLITRNGCSIAGSLSVNYKGLVKNTAQLHAVCAVQPVDGAATFDGYPGMSAPANGQMAKRAARAGRQAAAQRTESTVVHHHVSTRIAQTFPNAITPQLNPKASPSSLGEQ